MSNDKSAFFSYIRLRRVIFAKWGEVFGDPVIANAIIDRLVHHSEIVKITGPSYRVKDRTIFDEDFGG